jgi:uncharacterized protein (DUF1778 family)
VTRDGGRPSRKTAPSKVYISVRVTKDERKELRRRAKANKVNVSEYVRAVCFQRERGRES